MSGVPIGAEQHCRDRREDWSVITVAMQSGNAAEVSQYLLEHSLHFPVIIDEEGDLARRYGVVGVPASFVIDGLGDIRFSEVGYTTGMGLRVRLWWAGQIRNSNSEPGS